MVTPFIPSRPAASPEPLANRSRADGLTKIVAMPPNLNSSACPGVFGATHGPRVVNDKGRYHSHPLSRCDEVPSLRSDSGKFGSYFLRADNAPLVRSSVAPGTPTSVRVSNDTNDSPVAIPRRPLRTTTSFIFINWIDKLKAHRGTKDFHYFLRDRFDRLVETRSECADQAQHWSLARRRQIDMDLVQAIIKVRTELLCRD